MNQKEMNLRQKIKRRSNAINKLEVEISRNAEILAMIDYDETEQKKIVDRIRKLKAREEKALQEKKEFIRELIDKYYYSG